MEYPMPEDLQHYLSLMEEKHANLEQEHVQLQKDFDVISSSLKELIEILIELFPAGATNTRAIQVKRYLLQQYPLFLDKISPMYLVAIREEIQHSDKKRTRRK
jgi:hypothetical protein